MGMNVLPATMANAAPGNAAATPAPTVPVVAQATDPVVTAAPGQTENIMPNQPTEGNTLPADGQVIGQVMPGVRGANAPVVADNAPSRAFFAAFARRHGVPMSEQPHFTAAQLDPDLTHADEPLLRIGPVATPAPI